MTYREVIRRMRSSATTAARVRWVVNGHCALTVPRHRGDHTPGTLASVQRQGAHCLGEGWLR